MKGKYSSPSRESRSNMRGKRRKTNLILNLLIGFVILLIIVVSATIFLGGSAEETAEKQSGNKVTDSGQENQSPEDDPADSEDETPVKGENNSSQGDSSKLEEETVDTDKESDSQPEKKEIAPANEEEAVVTTGGEEENVKKTIVNPSWQPIGTSQSGEHTSVYDADSVDWAEMLQALSYAAGVEQDNMTVWFLGNNGHNRSVGTISSKDQQKKYRVYMQWVDGQGWKPEKVEELDKIEN
ncbi:DUF1510 family protein [Bacillus sp. JJ1503]|uniref:DUF1510 family protein n=1 Tax=Bacillus sp. JJ1503 TaxID=3122956 RepID=UPI002FFDE36C